MLSRRNETLRLQPAAPNGSPRDPPSKSGPFLIAGHIVPDDTTVQIATYTCKALVASPLTTHVYH
jgi:hypothetical protein